MIMRKYVIAVFIVSLWIGSSSAYGQTNELTYQGRLTANGSAANTPHDLEFRLCASETDCGSPLETKQRLNVSVANGVFTVKLDFDPTHFSGADQWLEIAVKPAGTGTYTMLIPRQRVTSAPYSIKSLNSETATTATNATQLGGVAAAQFVQTNDSRLSDERNPLPNSANYIQNRVTPQPNASFNISGSGNIGGALRIEASGFFLPNTPSLSLSSNGIFQIDAPFQPSGRFVVLENGNVGIGHGAPTEKLQVAGNVSVSGTLAGNGVNLTNLNASNMMTGTLDNARLGVIPIANGGTGSSTKNFIDLTTTQTVTGNKTFSSAVNTTAQYNIGGNRVLSIAGTNNLFAGVRSGFSNESGTGNAFVGALAGELNSTGRENAFFGWSAGRNNTTGIRNSFFGAGAGAFHESGDSNSFFGENAGNSNRTGSHNTLIGTNANVGASNLTFATAIGAFSLVNNSNSIVLGRGLDTVRIPGNLIVTGSISKAGGSFKIDHPLDPQNRYLSHSFVESPDMMNVYNGNVVTDERGEAIVKLPDYFEALNGDFRYQLTVIGQFAQAIVGQEIKSNRFKIQTDKPGVKVSWQVTGIRRDKFAEDNRIPNEEDKSAQERGRCLYAPLCNGASINDAPRKP